MTVLFLLACGADTPPSSSGPSEPAPEVPAAPVVPDEARVLARDPTGEPSVRAVVLEGEGCPRERVEVREGDAWRALHTVEGAAHVAISPSGQVGGYASCAERLTSIFVDDWIHAHAGEPEGAVGIAWEGRILHVLAQDAMHPVQPLTFAPGPAGWTAAPGPCTALEEHGDGRVTWGDPRAGGEPTTFTVALRTDLDADDREEMWLVGASDGTPYRPSALVTACPQGTARPLHLGDAAGQSLSVGERVERGWKVLELTAPDAPVSPLVYDGFVYRPEN